MIARTIRSICSSASVFYVAGFLLIALILLAKNPYLYIYPPLDFDDSLLLSHHVNNPGSLVYFYRGYFTLVPNIMAKIAITLFPLKWIPRIFAIESLLICTLTIWLFCLNWYAPLVSNRNARLTIAALIAIQPIGVWTIQSMLLFQIYSFVIIIILLLVAEQSIDNLKWLFMTVIIIIFTWSNPMSVCFLPVFVFGGIRAFQQKNMVRLGSYLILSINVPIYIYKGVRIIQNDVPTINQFYYIAASSLATGLERILFGSFFPIKLQTSMRDESQLIPMAIAVFIFIFMCFLVLKAAAVNRNIRRLSILTAYTCLTITVFTIASRFRPGIPWYVVEKGYRYFYVQKYCVLLLFLISAYLLIKQMKQPVRILLVLMAFVWVIAAAVIDNDRYHYIIEYSDDIMKTYHIPLSLKRESLYNKGLKVAECLDRAQDSAATQETLVCEDPPIRLNFGRDKKK